MSVKPRTIDNLGIETSNRYAKDKQTLDPKLIEESRFVPSKAEVSVYKPYVPQDMQEYLLPQTQTIWALFEPPQGYLGYTRALFTHQLIPSLGDMEKQQADKDKIEALEDSLNRSFKDKSQGQSQQEDQKEEKERKVVLELLKTIGKLDQALTAINARRSQYQRG